MHLLQPDTVAWPAAAALLILRVILGFALFQHGKPKLGMPSKWMQTWGMTAAPGLLQVLVVFVEVVGGLALVLGLLTRLAGLGLVCIMLGALFQHHWPKGDVFVAPGKPNYEMPLVYAALGLTFLALGAGPWSLDALLFR